MDILYFCPHRIIPQKGNRDSHRGNPRGTGDSHRGTGPQKITFL